MLTIKKRMKTKEKISPGGSILKAGRREKMHSYKKRISKTECPLGRKRVSLEGCSVMSSVGGKLK